MSTQSDMSEFVRTLVLGDYEANDRYEKKLDQDGWRDWPPFLSALFFLTVDRRFDGAYDEAKVIRFVAELRADTATGGGSELDPAHAEQLIRAVLAPPVRLDIAPEAMGRIQTLVAYTILSQEGVSAEALDEILAEAGSIAESQRRRS